MKMIYICSPLRGHIEENVENANKYSKEVALQGDIPIAPHCIFTQFLNDNVPEEREMGLEMGLELLEKCKVLKVCGMEISEGMAAEIKKVMDMEIEIVGRDLSLTEIYDCVFYEEVKEDINFS